MPFEVSPKTAIERAGRRRYREVRAGVLQTDEAEPGQLHRALSWAHRIHDYEIAERIECALSNQEKP